MIIAVVDNGSLEPAAHLSLRSVARALSQRTGQHVRAVSWKHSDRIPLDALGDSPAWTLDAFIRSLVALGQREFVFVPFFISAQGAIGSALRRDLEQLQVELNGFEFTLTDGLAAGGILPEIVADRVRATLAARVHPFSCPPPLIVVDHGGPSAASASLRDRLAAGISRELGSAIGPVAAASMEGAHPPLLADLLRSEEFAGRDVIVAPLFLSPGRHAGPQGDIAQICASADARCHVTDLVGHHPLSIRTLANALNSALATLHAPSPA